MKFNETQHKKIHKLHEECKIRGELLFSEDRCYTNIFDALKYKEKSIQNQLDLNFRQNNFISELMEESTETEYMICDSQNYKESYYKIKIESCSLEVDPVFINQIINEEGGD